jgi:glutathione S-transferase
MADIAMAPYVNRLSALSMSGLWEGGRLPSVENWFSRVRDRAMFRQAFLDWTPAELIDEMRINGERSWPDIKRLLE